MELYKDPMYARELIMDRQENPEFKKTPPKNLDGFDSYTNKSESCIDNITVYIKIENLQVKEIFFDGIGCAISTASTDLLCKTIINQKVSDIKEIILNYKKMISGDDYNESLLDILIIFRNISKQLNRIRCALSGCVAIEKILEQKW